MIKNRWNLYSMHHLPLFHGLCFDSGFGWDRFFLNFCCNFLERGLQITCYFVRKCVWFFFVLFFGNKMCLPTCVKISCLFWSLCLCVVHVYINVRSHCSTCESWWLNLSHEAWQELTFYPVSLLTTPSSKILIREYIVCIFYSLYTVYFLKFPQSWMKYPPYILL